MRMRMLSRALLIALMLSLTGVAGASAADLCFQDTTFGNLFIAKSLSLPTANNCKTFNGFFASTFDPISGNVCRSHNSMFPFYVFNLQITLDTIDAIFAPFFLDVSTLNGSGHYLRPDFGNGGSSTAFSIAKVPCPPIRQFGP